jgi:hypothetical protein
MAASEREEKWRQRRKWRKRFNVVSAVARRNIETAANEKQLTPAYRHDSAKIQAA